jgi:hypothetical protein
MCLADSREAVAAFGHAKRDWLNALLLLLKSRPSHDTIYRVFVRLNPDRFGEPVFGWMKAVCEEAGLRHIVGV